jgi:hypothetical protein
MSKVDKDAIRKSMRDSLVRSTERSYAHRDDSGKFASIFKDDPPLPMWKCTESSHKIDILPYIVGTNHPKEQEGAFDYLLDVWVHYGVGINEDAVVCMLKTYGKKCAVCEWQKILREQEGADEDFIKSLNPKRRAIYNIVCLDNEVEKEKGVQVWDASFYLMERCLSPLTRQRDDDDENYYWCDLENGKSVRFERKGTGNTNTQIIGHELIKRKEQYGVDDIDATYQLDMCIKIPDYDELLDSLDDGLPHRSKSGEEAGNADRGLRKGLGKPAVRQPEPERSKPKDDDDNKDAGKPGVDGECPAGHELGSDMFDKVEDENGNLICEECVLWKDCAMAFKERQKKAVGKEKEKPKEDKKAAASPQKRTLKRR